MEKKPQLDSCATETGPFFLQQIFLKKNRIERRSVPIRHPRRPREEASWLALADGAEGEKTAQPPGRAAPHAPRPSPGPPAPRFLANRNRLRMLVANRRNLACHLHPKSIGCARLIPRRPLRRVSPTGEGGVARTARAAHEVRSPERYTRRLPVHAGGGLEVTGPQSQRIPPRWTQRHGLVVNGMQPTTSPSSAHRDAPFDSCENGSPTDDAEKRAGGIQLPDRGRVEYACRACWATGPFYFGKTASSETVKYKGTGLPRVAGRGRTSTCPCAGGAVISNPFACMT